MKNNEGLTKLNRPDREYIKQKPGYPKPVDYAYENDITRQIWQYVRNHKELGIDSGWDTASGLVIMNADTDDHTKYARINYNHDTDSIDVTTLADRTTKSFPFEDATIEEILLTVIDSIENKTTKKESYYSQGNHDGRWFRPAKAQESFPSQAAYLSYKKGYNDGSLGIYEATNDPKFDAEIKDLKSKKDMPELVSSLNNLTPEQLVLLEKGFGDGELATDMDTEEMDIKAKDLHPTQNEIDVGKSLSYQISGKNPDQIKQILDGGPVTVNLPLVVYDYRGTYYIVDGHHRWSQVFMLNPNCTIKSIVFKNSAGDTEQDPADMLRDFQGAIAVANDGDVPSSKVQGGMNIFDWSSDQLRKYLDDESTGIQDGMISAYRDFYNSEIDKSDIENAIIGNAGLMLKSNKPIKNAPSRSVMPQTDTGNNAGLKTAMAGMTDI